MLSQLPASANLLVCTAVAHDPDPLHSLSRRIRTLRAIAAVNRELRELVHTMVYPSMIRMLGLQEEPEPTLANLARLPDASVSDMVQRLSGSVPSGQRAESVDLILQLAPRLWCIEPLFAELRRRRSRMVTGSEARERYRVRPVDLVGLQRSSQGLLCVEDVMDRSYARYGCTPSLQRHDARIREAASKRVLTMRLQAERCAQLAPELRTLARTYGELGAAVRAFASSGDENHARAASSLYANRRREMDERARELGVLPQAPPCIRAAYDAYVTSGLQEHKRRVTAFLDEWQWVVRESAGIHADLIRASVDAHFIFWLASIEDASTVRAHTKHRFDEWRAVRGLAEARLTARCHGPRALLKLEDGHLARGGRDVDAVVRAAERAALCEFSQEVRSAVRLQCQAAVVTFDNVVRTAYENDRLSREEAVEWAVSQLLT